MNQHNKRNWSQYHVSKFKFELTIKSAKKNILSSGGQECCGRKQIRNRASFFLKIDVFVIKSFCSILLSCHSSLCRLVAPSPHPTRLTLSSIKLGSSNCPGTLLVSEVISSWSLADESNASSGIRDLNCDLNGLNTAKVIWDTNSKPRNPEI